MKYETLVYTPPPTIRAFIRDYTPGELFYDWIVGPYGSGKTTGLFFKLAYMAKMQAKSPDGIRRTRAVIVRNTSTQLNDTTIVSWDYWFKDGQAGKWRKTEKAFLLKFDDVECEVLFRPLDTAEDVARVLSLEVTFAIVDEFVQTPREIIEALSGRCGRYPSKAMVPGGATNWGMWGSSNPSTEDNWWFDYLHTSKDVMRVPYISKDDDVNKAIEATMARLQGKRPIARYYVQPGGLTPLAENIENLPGNRGYYTKLVEGKSEAWVKQFVDSEWGYSATGQPVVSGFNPAVHVSNKVKFNPRVPLVGGMDPGLSGSAIVFGQQDLDGRLQVMGELAQSGYGADRMVRERIRPYLDAYFPGARLIIAPDPSAANRAQADENTVIKVLKKYFEVVTETNNRLPLRLNAIDHYVQRTIGLTPALLIDEHMCPILTRALKGGWRFELDTTGDVKGLVPEKNSWSHTGDAFGYLCRYYHKMFERADREAQARAVNARPMAAGTYHIR